MDLGGMFNRVIGEGGSNAEDLRTKTGAMLTFIDEESAVILSGSPASRHKARSEIQGIIDRATVVDAGDMSGVIIGPNAMHVKAIQKKFGVNIWQGKRQFKTYSIFLVLMLAVQKQARLSERFLLILFVWKDMLKLINKFWVVEVRA
eukprot:TRINITY_DN4765_c0_g1_i1.p1 TRINITY_DN4765_c0_g1~~TRINITY_DN4765_c0_g1_i1.p1  ORF type:complete len:168 (-),score=37.20 TRINITY_DN4765_c0_g1_i1:93-533(-)